jgi:hypothetical protein
MTELIINGKHTTPLKHTIIGYEICGCEQIDDDITKLILKDCASQSGAQPPHADNIAMDEIALEIESVLKLTGNDLPLKHNDWLRSLARRLHQ